jgi:cell filamentation protein
MNPYVDPETGTHYNKLGITSKDDLRKIEYAVTDLRIAELLSKPPAGKFDLDHLKKVHEHIFGDLYEWAGRERTVNFSKRDAEEPWWKSTFAPHDKIRDIANTISGELEKTNYLQGLNQKDFTRELTSLYVKVNYLHPFVEGNGRSTQTFLTQLARQAGYELNFGAVDKDEWNHSAARSMPQQNIKEPTMTRPPDTRGIEQAFKRIVEPLRERERDSDRGR